MTVQILQAPIRPATRSAASGIARYLWMRFYRIFRIIAAAWLVSAIVDHYFFAGKITTVMDILHGPSFVTAGLIPGLLILGPMMAVSEIDASLWTLPLSTERIVGWMMLYGSLATGMCWIADAVFIWRPAGLDAPIWWPAAMLAAVQAAALSIRSQPFAFGTLHALIYSLSTVLLVLGGIEAVSGGVAPSVVVVGYAAISFFAYIMAVVGAKWTRCGDTIGGLGLTESQRTGPLRGRFRSADRSQAWFEWRNHGFYMAAAVAGLGVLTLPVLGIPLVSEIGVITMLTHHTRHVSANMWAANVPPFLAMALLYFALVIGCASPGMRESDKTLSPFLATRPLDCSGLVAAKLRSAALSAAAAWAAIVPFFISWMSLPAWENFHQISLGAAFWNAVAPVLNAHTITITITGLLALFYFSWKFQVETLFLQLTGRAWVPWVFTGIVLLPLAIPPFYSHVLASPAVRPVLPGALLFLAALKLGASTVIVATLRRRGLISARTLRSALTMWAAGALTFFVLLCVGFAAGRAEWPTIALGVVLLMPGVRLALAPLALAWDRSR
ncbi:MAG: hypothetical protein ABIY70_06405 [Capsulimonas sp.]|uniref:hypothetical protein n=1 Tax=Capsulimonas sp. TaxID=2494211 RepID=UPI003263935F